MKKHSGQRRDEDAIQAAICLHLTVRGLPGIVWWHTPNGGSRSKVEAGRFKALGVKAGIPDLIAIHRGHVFGLELKADNGRLSPAQNDMLAALESAGASVAVVFGLDAALAQLDQWGLLRTSHTSCSGRREVSDVAR